MLFALPSLWVINLRANLDYYFNVNYNFGLILVVCRFVVCRLSFVVILVSKTFLFFCAVMNDGTTVVTQRQELSVSDTKD
jgi:hypothetical protein